MAGKADQLALRIIAAAPRPEIRHAASINTLDGKAQRCKPGSDQVKTPGILRRNRRARNQRPGFFKHLH